MLQFTLVDDLGKSSYPLMQLWLSNLSAAVGITAEGDQAVVAAIPEIALELAKSLKAEKPKYANYPTYFRTHVQDTRKDVTTPYKEIMYKQP